MVREKSSEAIETYVQNFPASRQDHIPLRNGRSGRESIRSFIKRPRSLLADRQEAKKYKATHGETLATHIVTLEQLVKKCNIDGTRVSNLDETGGMPEKYICERGRRLCLKQIRDAQEFRVNG